MIDAYATSVELSDDILLAMLTNLDARLEYVVSHEWTTIRAMRLVEEVRRLRQSAEQQGRDLAAALGEVERLKGLFLTGKTAGPESKPWSGV